MTVNITASAPNAQPMAMSRGGAVRRLLRNPLGLFSVVFLGLVVLMGVLSPLLAPHDPNLAKLELTNAPPFSGDFVLGGDQAGRDILARLMVATLGTLTASCVVLIVSLTLGVSTGLVAGYFAGWFETVSSWVANAVMALPGFVLLIAMYTVIGPSILTAMAVFGVLIAPSYYRLVRGLVTNVRHELYVDAAKVSGLSDYRIISRHVLRAVRAPIIIQSSFVLSAGIAIQAGLEFLGLGDPTAPSWGGMLQDAFNTIYVARLNVVWPALLISLTTLTLVLLGNALRDVLQAGQSQGQPLHPREVRRLQANHVSDRADETTHDALGVSGDGAHPVLLAVRDLVIAYPTPEGGVKEVVRGVNLTVRRAEIHGLVGQSGSGKSQTAYSVLGILPREAVILGGQVTFEGQDLRDQQTLRQLRGKRLAYVPQEPMSNLDPTFTVGQQLMFGLRAVKQITRSQARQELLHLLGQVGIADPARTFDAYPHQISGGMAQRVLIAGAIAGDPDLIIADEPTTALDVTVQAGVLELLRDLQQERQLGMILVTHNFGVVADICDRVSVMEEGRIVETNTTQELFRDPQDEYTRMLLASTLDGESMRAPLKAKVS